MSVVGAANGDYLDNTAQPKDHRGVVGQASQVAREEADGSGKKWDCSHHVAWAADVAMLRA